MPCHAIQVVSRNFVVGKYAQLIKLCSLFNNVSGSYILSSEPFELRLKHEPTPLKQANECCHKTRCTTRMYDFVLLSRRKTEALS